jgi:pimeloyl-ACP methyl ester carboxylesterase
VFFDRPIQALLSRKLDVLMQSPTSARRRILVQAQHAQPAVRRNDVEFKSGGVICRAWAYSPRESASRPAPCIVMAHGLSGTRDAGLEPYALRFAEAGFHVLLFDYRHLGASDGEPRQLISIAQQLADWAAAIEFARGMAGVDAGRIALWGCSLSGGHVVVAAARDPRIAAISAQCPMLDGAASARMARRGAGVGAMLRLARAALIDLARAALGREPYYVPLAAPPGELAAMASHDAYAGCRAIMPPGWRNAVAARILLAMPFYRPLRHAAAVRCPALLIACTQDSVTSSHAAAVAAARMGDKARLIELPIGHFDIYLGQCFERSSREQVAFFKAALRA